jgi:hypothetical protein
VIAATAIAGCGTLGAAATAGGSGSGSHRPVTSAGDPMIRLLCPQPRSVRSVRVVRFAERGQMGQTKPLPRPVPGITIKDPAAVRKLAQAICRLPRMPRGVINCPADRGGGFVLVFSAPGQRFHAVTLRSSGCQTVTGTGSGRARWVVRTPQFWKQLAEVTGIASPAHAQA